MDAITPAEVTKLCHSPSLDINADIAARDGRAGRIPDRHSAPGLRQARDDFIIARRLVEPRPSHNHIRVAGAAIRSTVEWSRRGGAIRLERNRETAGA